MVKCPKCGEEVDHLIDWSKVWEKYYFTADGEYGEYEYSGDSVSADEPDRYECPECGETLFNDEEEALRFLRGE